MDGKDKLPSLSSAAGAHDKTIINTIMLRFRPIAPKPADESLLRGFSPMSSKNPLFSKRRTKRKYVRVCKSNRFNKKKITASDRELQKERGAETVSNGLNGAVTLQLFPEKSDPTDSPRKLEETWCNLDLNLQPLIDPTAVTNPHRVVVVDAWVTVECVTYSESCMDGENNRLGFGEVERVKNELEKDTCPGFVSDGWNNVVWVNGAFKRMVTGSDDKSFEVRVLFGVKEKMLVCTERSRVMTCWVKVQYTRQEEKCFMMVPCDAWRLEDGGFAWKLDVEASLRLGR